MVHELSCVFAIRTLIQCQTILELTGEKLQIIKMMKNSFRVSYHIFVRCGFDQVTVAKQVLLKNNSTAADSSAT